MRKIIETFFLLVIFTECFSQETSILNVGANYLIISPVKLGYSESRFKSNPGFFIEKPFKFTLLSVKSLYIMPGIAYFSLHENYSYGRSSNSFNRDVDHKSVSSYLKITCGINRFNSNSYFGVFSGIHLFSSSKGEEQWTVYYGNGQKYGGNEIIENKGKSDFYHLIYYGLLLGFKSDIEKAPWLKPGLQFKLLPNFGKVIKDDIKKNFGGFEITLILDFSANKATRN